jgi:hypothetical protein
VLHARKLLHKSLNLAIQANVRKTSGCCHFLKGASALDEKKSIAGQIDARWTPMTEEDYRPWLKQDEALRSTAITISTWISTALCCSLPSTRFRKCRCNRVSPAQ